MAVIAISTDSPLLERVEAALGVLHCLRGGFEGGLVRVRGERLQP
jgi:hypothetical protein